jgi:hypothetical protein
MEQNEVTKGILAVYDRPEDMNPVFDGKRLQVFEILMDDHRSLLAHVNREIDKFRVDLERLKENPLLSEQDFLPAGSLTTLADKVAKFENQLSQMKEIENQLKEAKKALYAEMVKRNVKSWSMPNGTKITRVDEVPASTKTVIEFDVERFKAEHPAAYHQFSKAVEKNVSGKAGYVRITVR